VTGKARLGYRPSKKSIKRMVERVHALTDRADTWQETTRAGGSVDSHAQLLHSSILAHLESATFASRRQLPRRQVSHDRHGKQIIHGFVPPVPSADRPCPSQMVD
jgi:hypothetical protein